MVSKERRRNFLYNLNPNIWMVSSLNYLSFLVLVDTWNFFVFIAVVQTANMDPEIGLLIRGINTSYHTLLATFLFITGGGAKW